MNVPKLRFGEFKSSWKFMKLGQLGNTIAGLTYSPKDIRDSGLLVLRSSNVKDGQIDLGDCVYVDTNVKGAKISQENDILICVRNGSTSLIGKNALIPAGIPHCTHGAFMTVFRAEQPKFIHQLFQTTNYKTQVSADLGARINSINNSQLIKYQFAVPPTECEQQKIADFLSAVDDKITALTAQKTALTQYKQGMMQRIFAQTLRFKDDNGVEYPEWDIKTLGELAKKSTSKNKDESVKTVFTNSAVQGIVNQLDFFDKDIANQNNLANYYIVEKNDFVYNPRISKFAPVGPIKRNHLGTGVMSPLYTVFRFNEGNLGFMSYLFDTAIWHDYMFSIANFGVRFDRMNISQADFFEMPIAYPCIEEQTKIAQFLTELDNKINAVDAQIQSAQQWKQGLLQQMFV